MNTSRTIEEKAKAYDEALKRAKEWITEREQLICPREIVESIFPELSESESEDERIRITLIHIVKGACDKYGIKYRSGEISEEKLLSYLEKQKEHWTPSKEVMDVLYALAYITNEVDNHKDDVITRLYQDLKREFFNGASYENMFPKEDERKEQKSVIGLKFRVGDTIYKKGENTILPRTIERIEDGYYIYDNDKGFINIKFQDDYELVEQKQEWSEEDKEKLKAICTYLRDYSRLAKLGEKLRLNEYCDFLKSLRPSWKPSEEQMEALNYVIAEWDGGKRLTGLYALWNDLKKLI